MDHRSAITIPRIDVQAALEALDTSASMPVISIAGFEPPGLCRYFARSANGVEVITWQLLVGFGQGEEERRRENEMNKKIWGWAAPKKVPEGARGVEEEAVTKQANGGLRVEIGSRPKSSDIVEKEEITKQAKGDL